MTTALPRTAKDVFDLSAKDWIRFNALIAFKRASGGWRYPLEQASGDLETMQFRDLVYWLYKAAHPITRAERSSELEAFFANQAKYRWVLPAGFRVEHEATLSAVGDLMDHPYLGRSRETLYASVADTIFGADISMANLECVVDATAPSAFKLRTTEGPTLCYTADHFRAVQGDGRRRYSFMTTANNHSLDRGERGVISTLEALLMTGIASNGTSDSEQASYEATVLSAKGVRIGLLSHTFGLNAKRPPADKPWLVNRSHLNGRVDEIDFTRIERQIADCRRHDVDAIVAQLHWGMEHECYPRRRQLDVAHHLAELGCDVVIGHHPHVVQPMERYRTARDPDRVVPIYYSLGNLVTPFTHPAFRRSAVARIRLVKGTTAAGITRTYVGSADAAGVWLRMDRRARQLALAPATVDV